MSNPCKVAASPVNRTEGERVLVELPGIGSYWYCERIDDSPGTWARWCRGLAILEYFAEVKEARERSEITKSEEEKGTMASETLQDRIQQAGLWNGVLADQLAKGDHAELVDISPALATVWLEQDVCEFQRLPRPYHVRALARAMQKGTFKPGASIQLYWLNGKLYIVDGKHRLRAIVESGTTYRMVVVSYNARTEVEIKEAYRNTDRGLARTLRDAARSCDLPDTFGLSAAQIERYFGAVWIMARGFTASHGVWGDVYARDIEFKIDLTSHFREEILAYESAIAGRPKNLTKEFILAPVAGVALSTFASRPAQARKFWSAAAANDGLGRSDPERALVDMLLMRKDRKSPLVIARWVARCWNAYAEGKRLSVIKTPDMGNPILIRGTPFDGKDYVYIHPDTLEFTGSKAIRETAKGETLPIRGVHGRFIPPTPVDDEQR